MSSPSSNLYSDSSLSDRRWVGAGCRFIDMSLNSLLEMATDSSKVSYITTLTVNGEIQPIFSPMVVNDDDEDTNLLVGNAYDIIPSQAFLKTSTSSCGFFVSILPKSVAGELAEGHATLPGGLLADTSFAGVESILLQVPSICPFPFGTKPPTGAITDLSVVNVFSRYPEHKLWLTLATNAIENKSLLAKIQEELESNIRTYLPGYNENNLNPNGPYALFNPVCLSTVDENTELFEKLELIRNRFKQVSPSSSSRNNSQGTSNLSLGNNGTQTSTPSNSNGVDINSETFLRMAKIIAHPDHEVAKKADDLSLAIIKNMNVCGEINWETGKIVGELEECTLAPGLLTCYDYKGSTRTQQLKSYFETGMESPDEEDLTLVVSTIDQDRCMKQFSTSAMLQFSKGNFEKETLENLTSDGSYFDILTLACQRDKGKIELLKKNEIQRRMEEEMGVPESQRTKVSASTPRPGCLEHMDDVKSLAANMVEFHNLCAIIRGTGGKEVIATQLYMRLYLLFANPTVDGWMKKMHSKQPQFYVIAFKSLERIFRLLATFSMSSKNVTYSLAKNMSGLSKHQKIHLAVAIVHNFVKDVQLKIGMDDYFTTVPDITPDSANPNKIKEARALALRPPVQENSSNADAPSEKPGSTKKRKTQKPPGLVATESKKIDPKTRGFFIPDKGCTAQDMFGHVTPLNGKTPCFHHHAIGEECSHGKMCKFLHGSAIRMKAEMLKEIFDGMLNHGKAKFNPELKNGRFGQLVDAKYSSLWPSEAAAPSPGA